MSNKPQDEAGDTLDPYLKGTTYRVYRFILKEGKPLGVSEIQKSLGLSSPSVAQYHIKKLLRLGLVREEQAGYVVERVVIENVIRIRRTSIPIQSAYVAFFAVTLGILAVLLRPAQISSLYVFAVAINIAALAISLYEAAKTWRRL
jgi:predicted DNA-binding transcriptional regulator